MKRHNHKSPRTKALIQQLNSKIKSELPNLKLPLLNPHPPETDILKSERKLSEQFHLKVATERGHHQSSINRLSSKQS